MIEGPQAKVGGLNPPRPKYLMDAKLGAHPRLVASNPPRPKYLMDAKLGAQQGCNQGWCLQIHQAPRPNNFMDAKLGAQKGCTMSPLRCSFMLCVARVVAISEDGISFDIMCTYDST